LDAVCGGGGEQQVVVAAAAAAAAAAAEGAAAAAAAAAKQLAAEAAAKQQSDPCQGCVCGFARGHARVRSVAECDRMQGDNSTSRLGLVKRHAKTADVVAWHNAEKMEEGACLCEGEQRGAWLMLNTHRWCKRRKIIFPPPWCKQMQSRKQQAANSKQQTASSKQQTASSSSLQRHHAPATLHHHARNAFK